MSVVIKEELQNLKAELSTFKDSVMAYLLEMKQNSNDRSSRPKVFCKKGVLWNFAKFTGKDLCQSLFFNKVAL